MLLRRKYTNPSVMVLCKMDKKKIADLLGLAQKAGRIVSGEFAVEKAVRSRKAKLVLLATDASVNSKKSYHDLTSYYEVPIYEVLSKQEMGESIGKVQRAAIVLTDEGFNRALVKLLSDV